MRVKLLLAIFIISLTSSISFAQMLPPPICDHRNDRYHYPRHRFEKYRALPKEDIYMICKVADISFTGEQTEKMNKIDYEYELKINKLIYEKRSINYKLQTERKKIDADLKIIKDLISQKKDLEKEIDYLKVEKDFSMLDVLTEEQLTKLNNYRMKYNI